jgi:Mn-dependent DtxR family transcriptional regulator
MAVLVEIHNSIKQDQYNTAYSTIPKRVLSERLNISQKSIFNILNVLEAFGYIERIGENGYIKVTSKAYNTK